MSKLITLRNKQFSWQRVLILIAASEFFILFISGVSFSGLYRASFFDFGVDVFFGLFYLTGLPQLIVDQLWLGIALDSLILVLMLLLCRNPYNNRIAIVLFLVSLLLYVTMMGYLTHRNYHVGFFLVWTPFLFRSKISRAMAYEASRYYLLFFYLSAGILKLLHGVLASANNFSANLLNQFKPYYLEGNSGIRSEFNLYLINHPTIAYIFLLGATAVELFCIMGFFTKKWDGLIAGALLLFHACNWFIMDIAPIGQLAFVCLLFAGRQFVPQNSPQA